MKTKKIVLIFLLIIASAFQGFADETEGEAEPDDKTILEQSSLTVSTPAPDNDVEAGLRAGEEGINYWRSENEKLQRQIRDLWYEREDLQRQIANLEARLSELTSNQGAGGNFPSAAQPDGRSRQDDRNESGRTGSGFSNAGRMALIIIFSAAVLALCLALYIIMRRQRLARKNPADSARGQDQSPYRQSGQARPYAPVRPYSSPGSGVPPSPPLPGSAGTSFGSFPPRQAAPQTVAPKPPVDEISPLYHSREKRDQRHDSGPGDIFLDVSKSVLERLVQGEKVPLIFERGGTRLSAKFVLVDNRHLYPNFHIYNETKELTRDDEKILLKIYDFAGKGLPGHVERCRPAVVSARANDFTISSMGILKISN